MVRESGSCVDVEKKGVQIAQYEIGRTLGEGNFGKVKQAKNLITGKEYAVKILDKKKILAISIDNQIKREIATLKLLRHPNVVRLYEVLATKTKIYMVLEYVTEGELFDKIASKGRFKEDNGRKIFHQLIDAVSYCHENGVYHRDLKLENVLVDSEANIKISDFGLSALPQNLDDNGLLHTTCGSPNYVAPEVLSNKGYDGEMADIWSCGVILYVILTGFLPFDDRNLAVLYQKIFRGVPQIPKWISPGASNLITSILDPNPKTRINIDGIKADLWFKHDYVPAIPEDDKEIYINDDAFFINEETGESGGQGSELNQINAFQLIGMSACLDLSGFFEKEDASERRMIFASNHSSKDLFERIDAIATNLGFQIQKRNGKLKILHQSKSSKNPGGGHVSVSAQVFELSTSVCVVELSKFYGDPSLYRELCAKLSNELGVCKSKPFLTGQEETTSYYVIPPSI
ncbi:CBL-interacting protein kinase 21 [Zostera marina]|uniref:non-specific serine/threonine protein kinase n=1 Tax=Zostera marina TaxID=29655 RepID=A0A0K9NLQ8_ZOSMR|nr:CBL-interacting protein kinase 21 [Zostera marina]